MLTHEAYVAISYVVTALTILGLAGWIYADGLARRRELERLEESAAGRRNPVSNPASGGEAR